MEKLNPFSFFDKNKEGNVIKIKLEEITMRPELKDAFHMDSNVKDRIKADMVANGFNKGHPIHIFRWEEKWVLCDGHTRYTAAKELGLRTVWAQVHQFETINQALLYSMKEQFNRRNIEDSELFKQFEVLRQEEIDGRKLTTAEMSERLKKSKRHIFKLQEVFSKSTKEQLKAIRDGKTSINQVYNEIKKTENAEAKKSEELLLCEKQKQEIAVSSGVPEISESSVEKSLEEKEKQDLRKKHRELQEKEIELKQKEAKISKRLSDKQILLLGAQYALIQKAKGKASAEILDSPFFADSVKAKDIFFAQEDLELLRAM